MLQGIGRFANARHGFCVVSLCQGKEGGSDFFAFIAIEPHNYNYFRKIYEKGVATDFSAFGQELLRGPGLAPSQDIIDYVRNKYDIEFNIDRRFMERLIAITTYSGSASPVHNNPPGKPSEAAGS